MYGMITVWCGMTSNRMVGAFILYDTMKAERYVTMLRDKVRPNYHLPVLETILIKDLIFMQNRAPPHFALVVHECLNAQFPEKQMSRRGSLERPAKSSHLTVNTLQLFFFGGKGGYLKEQVCSTKPRNLEKLETRIREVLTSIPQQLFVKSVNAVHGRI